MELFEASANTKSVARGDWSLNFETFNFNIDIISQMI